ncbi:MAG: glycerophosphodiester phosphodiesterase [Candidatus Kerfeldbacteria bacterium]
MSENQFIQHRGLRESQDRPNSFEAMREQYGVGIEFDLFILSDGTIAVLHDKDFQDAQLTQEQVEAMTLSELESMNVISRTDGERGGAIPLLREYIFNAYDRGIDLTMEIKASTPDKAEEAARAMVDEIAAMKDDGVFETMPDYPEQSLGVHSFSVEALQEAKAAMDEHGVPLKRGLFWPSAPERADEMEISKTAKTFVGYTDEHENEWAAFGLEAAKKLGCESLNLFRTTITPEIVEEAKKHNIDIYAWVVNNKEDAQRLLDMGVEKIITETSE